MTKFTLTGSLILVNGYMKFSFINSNFISILALIGAAFSLWLLYDTGKVFEAQIGAFLLFIAFCLIVWGSLRPYSTYKKSKKTNSEVKEAKSPNEAVKKAATKTDLQE